MKDFCYVEKYLLFTQVLKGEKTVSHKNSVFMSYQLWTIFKYVGMKPLRSLYIVICMFLSFEQDNGT